METRHGKANQCVVSPVAAEVAEKGNNDEVLDDGNVVSVMQLTKRIRKGNGSIVASKSQ